MLTCLISKDILLKKKPEYAGSVWWEQEIQLCKVYKSIISNNEHSEKNPNVNIQSNKDLKKISLRSMLNIKICLKYIKYVKIKSKQ